MCLFSSCPKHSPVTMAPAKKITPASRLMFMYSFYHGPARPALLSRCDFVQRMGSR
jgi:hypothetical protein